VGLLAVPSPGPITRSKSPFRTRWPFIETSRVFDLRFSGSYTTSRAVKVDSLAPTHGRVRRPCVMVNVSVVRPVSVGLEEMVAINCPVHLVSDIANELKA
jgi:hypothetical protein